MIKISVRSNFSMTPGARYPEEGEFSGQEFREKILEPSLRMAIKDKTILEVDLSGTAGFGIAFLEESFGGLVRSGFTPRELAMHLLITCPDGDSEGQAY